MIEHRLILRMIGMLRTEHDRIKDGGEPDLIFIDHAVDFIRTYADQTHHGKEEDILFRELKDKELSPEHQEIMDQLIAEHVQSRQTTRAIVDAKERYVAGEAGALDEILEKMEFLSGFYPAHIDKEDHHFFTEVIRYFTKDEQDALLQEGREFDRKMIHRKYEKVVLDHEQERGIDNPPNKGNWMEYL
jgi:hemerythrin-like domain-containing protein